MRKHKYSYLHNLLRSAKKEGLLSYSNRKLANAVLKLKEIGLLISLFAKKFTLADDYTENLEIYLKKATNINKEVM